MSSSETSSCSDQSFNHTTEEFTNSDETFSSYSSSSSSSSFEEEEEQEESTLTSTNDNSTSQIVSETTTTTTTTNNDNTFSSTLQDDDDDDIDEVTKTKPKKKKISKFLMIIFISIIIINLIIFFGLIIKFISNTYLYINSNSYINTNEIYEMIYYKNINNSSSLLSSFQGKIKETKKVQGYHFFDEEGSGYIMPISFSDGKNIEYKISSECSCCVECWNDENCKNELICSNEENENVCVECINDENCKNGLICKNGMCINGECKNHEDCGNMEICNMNGKCKKGCKDDMECNEPEEICVDGEGICIKGCRMDNDCKGKGEMCVYGECSSFGCKDNFDCDNYESVCIDSECVLVDETNSCVDDKDCSNDNVCNYEYMVCVKNRRETMINRRKNEMVGALCTIPAVITLFVMAASYTMISKMASDALLDNCIHKCALLGRKTKAQIQEEIQIIEEMKKTEPDSECTGNCRANKKLDIDKQFEAQAYCRKKQLKSIVRGKYTAIFSGDAKKVFNSELVLFCSGFKYGEWMYKASYIKKLRLKACTSDPFSIVCRKLIKN